MEDKKLETFAQQLASLKPANVSDDFALRLEAALAKADREMAPAAKVIAFPMAQWAVAAAALFVALLMAVQSTRVDNTPGNVVADVNIEAAEETLPVYQVVDGRLLQVDNASSMHTVKYRGVEVVDGRAFRQFRTDKDTFLQPIFSKPGDVKTSDK